ncbi:MAG TPA: hypothetical protein VF096_00025 [Azonexus sp.]
MSSFDKHTLRSLEATAAASAAYLDACDAGAEGSRLDPDYYRACADLLVKIFALVEPERDFPTLLKDSPAAREIAEAIVLRRRIEAGRLDHPT